VVHVVTAHSPHLWYDINGPAPSQDLIARCTLADDEVVSYALVTLEQALSLELEANALSTPPLSHRYHRAARSMVVPLLSRYPAA
jgi:hypothetical protein